MVKRTRAKATAPKPIIFAEIATQKEGYAKTVYIDTDQLLLMEEGTIRNIEFGKYYVIGIWKRSKPEKYFFVVASKRDRAGGKLKQIDRSEKIKYEDAHLVVKWIQKYKDLADSLEAKKTPARKAPAAKIKYHLIGSSPESQGLSGISKLINRWLYDTRYEVRYESGEYVFYYDGKKSDKMNDGSVRIILKGGRYRFERPENN